MSDENSTGRNYRRRYGNSLTVKHERPMSWMAPTKDNFSINRENQSSTKELSSTTDLNTKSPGHENSSPGGKLAQEIQDELLNCKICLGYYRQPKSLTCLHTFCAECIESHIQGEVTYKKYSDYRDFTCPLCRKRTSLPYGGVRKLPDNFLVTTLYEMVHKRKPSEFDEELNENISNIMKCQICQKLSTKKRDAHCKCLDCNKLLCKQCTEQHKITKVTQNHSLFDVKIEEDVICKVHPDETVRFFCEKCQECICILCTFNEHNDHEVLQFNDAVVKYKTDIETEKVHCQQQVEQFRVKLDKVNKVESVIKETEESINELANKLVDEIRCREKQLLEEIRNMYGEDLLNMIGNKSQLENQMADMLNAQKMSEMVLQRKDVELLLLKRDLQQKMTESTHVEFVNANLPITVDKIIKFIPGVLEFGCIQDMDRPLLTRPRCVKLYFNNGNYEEHSDHCIEASTQTESIPSIISHNKSVSTVPVESANKAVNTRTKIVQHPQSLSKIPSIGNTTSNIEVRPITSSEFKLRYNNSGSSSPKVHSPTVSISTAQLIDNAASKIENYFDCDSRSSF